jgi:hypothetical protein
MPEPFTIDGVRIRSLRQINNLPAAQKEAIYRTLLPWAFLARFDINPENPVDEQGRRLVTIQAVPGSGVFKITIRHAAEACDPLLYLELSDTTSGQIEVPLLIINDPFAERFDVDRDWQGAETEFGLLRRNLPEEERAMKAGLAPGQVRQGLRMMGRLMHIIEIFAARLGHDLYFSHPLAYHNAIVQERYGFGYVQGRRRMEWIDREFRPGGELQARLDGSTPFRQPGMERTVRGRSWAIHDGLLGEPWPTLGVKMVKQVGREAGICTFPGAVY